MNIKEKEILFIKNVGFDVYNKLIVDNYSLHKYNSDDIKGDLSEFWFIFDNLKCITSFKEYCYIKNIELSIKELYNIFSDENLTI